MACFDRAGNLRWAENISNSLADEGEQRMLQCYLQGYADETNFFLRLVNKTVVDTHTLTEALSGYEPTTNGYKPQLIEVSTVGWPTLALNSGDYMATSKQVSFQASAGSIGPVTYAVIGTSSDYSGKLIAYGALSQSRTLADGEVLKATYQMKLQ